MKKLLSSGNVQAWLDKDIFLQPLVAWIKRLSNSSEQLQRWDQELYFSN